MVSDGSIEDRKKSNFKRFKFQKQEHFHHETTGFEPKPLFFYISLSI